MPSGRSRGEGGVYIISLLMLAQRRLWNLTDYLLLAGVHPMDLSLLKVPLARNQYRSNSSGIFPCIRAGANTGATCICTEMNSSRIWLVCGNASSKIFSCIRASANTGPACIRAKINSPGSCFLHVLVLCRGVSWRAGEKQLRWTQPSHGAERGGHLPRLRTSSWLDKPDTLASLRDMLSCSKTSSLRLWSPFRLDNLLASTYHRHRNHYK